MTQDLDAQLRAAFAGLRTAEPRCRPDAVVAAAAARRRRARRVSPIRRARRIGLKPALALAAAAAAAAVAVLSALPAPEHARPRSLGAILRAAAAVAAERPPLTATDGYRYVRELSQETFYLRRDGREATVTIGQTIESWENANLDGRTELGPQRVVARSGDPALADALVARMRPQLGHAQAIGADIAREGLGPVPRLSELPDDPARLQATLEDTVRHRARWAAGLPTDAMVRFEVVNQAMRLLQSAAVPPRVRAAAFLMLGQIPGARALGTKADPRGRTGEAIAITLRNDGRWPSPDAPWPPSTEREIIFDPSTTEVLAVSGRMLDRRADTGDMAGATVVEAAGQVGDVGDRP
jgi:hypothetical protein